MCKDRTVCAKQEFLERNKAEVANSTRTEDHTTSQCAAVNNSNIL